MNILNYKLSPTKELLTACTGLLAPMHLMQSLNLDKVINQHFPALNSNRSIKASVFISTLVLSQHEGSSCLDDTIHIKKDKALCLLNKAKSTNPTGDWYLA